MRWSILIFVVLLTVQMAFANDDDGDSCERCLKDTRTLRGDMSDIKGNVLSLGRAIRLYCRDMKGVDPENFVKCAKVVTHYHRGFVRGEDYFTICQTDNRC